MIDPVTRSLLFYRGLYLAIALGLIFLRLLPLPHAAGALPGPDLLLGMTFAWVMRRQDYAPIWLIALVFLAEDFFLIRPPGLWSALVVMASEFIRLRAVLVRELSFMGEWALVSVVMLTIVIVYRIIFAVTLLPQASFGFALVQVLWSITAYPAVVLIARYVLALHKPGMGEVDAYGRRV